MSVDIEGFARTSPDRFTSVWGAWDIALDELGSVPGVEGIAGTTDLPFQAPSWSPVVSVPGDAPGTVREDVAGYAITPGFFATMGTRVLVGREFGRLDGPDAERVVIVNTAFVQAALRGRDPVGTTLGMLESGASVDVRVVGVVEDVIQSRADEGARPAIYVPYTQHAGPIRAVVRTSRPADAIGPELRRAAANFNPLVPLQDLGSMRDRIAFSRTSPRFRAFLTGSFALSALVLAAFGLYGTLAQSVGRQNRELGVRMALGARRGRVLAMVVRKGLRLTMAGVAAGTVAALLVSRVLGGFLYGVESRDPMTIVSVALLLGLVAVAASLGPARAATAVDPASVLRDC
jgi:predicted permease